MKNKCKYCGQPLEKDWIALNQKLISDAVKEYLCLDCMAEHFGCDTEDLELMIEQFKDEDCVLFK